MDFRWFFVVSAEQCRISFRVNHEFFRCVNCVLLKLKLAEDTFGLVAKEIWINYKSQLIFGNHVPLCCKLPLLDSFNYLSLKIVFVCNYCWVIFDWLLFYNSAFGSFDQNLFELDLPLIYTFPSDSFPPLEVFIREHLLSVCSCLLTYCFWCIRNYVPSNTNASLLPTLVCDQPTQ